LIFFLKKKKKRVIELVGLHGTQEQVTHITELGFLDSIQKINIDEASAAIEAVLVTSSLSSTITTTKDNHSNSHPLCRFGKPRRQHESLVKILEFIVEDPKASDNNTNKKYKAKTTKKKNNGHTSPFCHLKVNQNYKKNSPSLFSPPLFCPFFPFFLFLFSFFVSVFLAADGTAQQSN
jgi:hypothetical protein